MTRYNQLVLHISKQCNHNLVFFLLIGRLFQNKTYDTLNFERNYQSYFPIAVTIKRNGEETTIPLQKLRINQKLLIKNNEIIPADSILIRGEANIDYSFVTGESKLNKKLNESNVDKEAVSKLSKTPTLLAATRMTAGSAILP